MKALTVGTVTRVNITALACLAALIISAAILDAVALFVPIPGVMAFLPVCVALFVGEHVWARTVDTVPRCEAQED